jgi:hypothetical protein
MSKSAFIDRRHVPSETEIVTTLSSAHANWNSIVEEIRKVARTQEDFKFMYGKPYGWGIRFRLKGKLLAALYPNQNYYVVQVVLGPKQLEEADHLQLKPNAREAIQSANPYPEGKWLFIKVESGKDVEDVKELLKLKMKSI